MDSKSMHVFTEKQKFRGQVNLVGISKSLYYQQFNRLLAMFLPNYSLMPQRHKDMDYLASNSHCFHV